MAHSFKGNFSEISLEKIQIHSSISNIVGPKKFEHIKFTMDRFGQQLPVLGN